MTFGYASFVKSRRESNTWTSSRGKLVVSWGERKVGANFSDILSWWEKQGGDMSPSSLLVNLATCGKVFCWPRRPISLLVLSFFK